MSDLLLELFSEEIPARMQATAAEELSARLKQALEEASLEHKALRTFVTPRRLAVIIEGLPKTQPDQSIEKKGPRTNAPAQAIEGFCKSSGLPKEKLEVRGDTYFAVIHQKGKPTKDALVGIIEELLKNFPWPKSMRWGRYPMQWVRPLKNILCLLDKDVVPVTFGHLKANNVTYGHRFLGKGEIKLSSPAEYEAALTKQHVIADAAKRKDKIIHLASEAALKAGYAVKPDEGLLEEVTGLVEWPVCLVGTFAQEYLSLPQEVPVLVMRQHQKYFALLSSSPLEGEQKFQDTPERSEGGRGNFVGGKNGNTPPDSLRSSAPPQGGGYSLANAFLITANMEAKDGGKVIIAGNQKVLKARLEDGKFYWDHDVKKPLAEWFPKLEKMVFHAKLGSMAEKVERLRGLAALLAVFVPHAHLEKVERAAELCKCDLVSGMVGQFPELQGAMGRYYALAQGEEPIIADAIRDHYKPAGLEDAVPTGPVAATVALADKFDSLVGLFAVGEKPTGSKDPFALRRAAIGIIRIIFENKLRLPLRVAIDHALGTLSSPRGDAVVDDILAFFSDRLKVILKSEGIRHDLIEAIFDGSEDDLVRMVARVKALEQFLATDDGANLQAAFKRAGNIVRKEEKKDNRIFEGHVREALLSEPAERELFLAMEKIRTPVEKAREEENFTRAMAHIATLRGPVDFFFDKVMVNADDPALRENRLHLLAGICGLLGTLANFDKIEG